MARQRLRIRSAGGEIVTQQLELRVALLDRQVGSLVSAVRILTIAVAALTAAVVCREIYGQDKPTPVATPREATGWALGDVATLRTEDRPFARYVWIPPWGTPEWPAAINFAINTAASHAVTIQLGQPIANGWMLRYDLRRLAPQAKQLARLIETWDGLAIDDPYFHVPAANSKIQAAILAPHLEQPEAVALTALASSGGAIYRADWLLVKMLSTLEGGRYYDFLQVDRGQPKAGTQQTEWLATLGVFERQTQQLSADQRAGLFRSAVTGKPRRLDVFYGLGRGGNLVSITHDISDDDVAAEKHPIRNLLNIADVAHEIIVERPNGLHAFALTNGKGEFVDSAPDNVASDSTIPAPHTRRLQPAISCIRCHGPTDGWQPFSNDVQTILRSGLDVFTDLADKENTREQIIDRLAGLYAGDLDAPDGPLGRARRNYLAAVFRITGGPRVGQDDAGKLSVVGSVSALCGAIYQQQRYDLVTPARAALELGWQDATLADALGPVDSLSAVDPVVGSLLAGVSVNRSDWESVFADAALAAEARRKGATK